MTATGLFTTATATALREWQERNNMTVTGVAAASTWHKLWKGTR